MLCSNQKIKTYSVLNPRIKRKVQERSKINIRLIILGFVHFVSVDIFARSQKLHEMFNFRLVYPMVLLPSFPRMMRMLYPEDEKRDQYGQTH